MTYPGYREELVQAERFLAGVNQTPEAPVDTRIIMKLIHDKMHFPGALLTTTDLERGNIIRVIGAGDYHESIYYVAGAFLARNPVDGTKAVICIAMQPLYGTDGRQSILVKQPGFQPTADADNRFGELSIRDMSLGNLLCIYHPVEIKVGVRNKVTLGECLIPGIYLLAKPIPARPGVMMLQNRPH